MTGPSPDDTDLSGLLREDHRDQEPEKTFPWLLALALAFFGSLLLGVIMWVALTLPQPPSAPFGDPSHDSAPASNAITSELPAELRSVDVLAPLPELPSAEELARQPQVSFLPPAPLPDLFERTEVGALPVIGPDGTRPLDAYARPFNADDPRPRIAILIDGLGLHGAATIQAVTDMPGGVSFAFLPYSPDLDRWAGDARAAGHEFVLSVPMEPVGFPDNDPGPSALLVKAADRVNLDQLRRVMARAAGYVGITSYMGSRFTADAQKLSPVMTELRDRGLMYLDLRESPLSAAPSAAALAGTPFVSATLRIDGVTTRASIDEALAALEETARARGAALGVAGPLPVTYERLLAWLPTLEEKGFVLAPISALIEGGAGVGSDLPEAASAP